jgi:hypothetical protein
MRLPSRFLSPCLIIGALASLACGPGASTTAAPTIVSFAPTSTLVGNNVVITGTDFTSASALTFNGVPVTSYTLDSATQITAKVPQAASTGRLTVTTAAGTATSGSTFTLIPALNALSPTAGVVGSQVVFTGSGFIGTTRVDFGAMPETAPGAVFTVDSANQLTVTVPTGALTGAVTLTASGSLCTGPVYTVQ